MITYNCWILQSMTVVSVLVVSPTENSTTKEETEFYQITKLAVSLNRWQAVHIWQTPTFRACLSLMSNDLSCPFNSKNTSLSPVFLFSSPMARSLMCNVFPFSISTYCIKSNNQQSACCLKPCIIMWSIIKILVIPVTN